MGIFRASSWAHSQGTLRVRALGSKPRFWSTAKELQGTILYQYHGTTVTAVVPSPSIISENGLVAIWAAPARRLTVIEVKEGQGGWKFHSIP